MFARQKLKLESMKETLKIYNGTIDLLEERLREDLVAFSDEDIMKIVAKRITRKLAL